MAVHRTPASSCDRKRSRQEEAAIPRRRKSIQKSRAKKNRKEVTRLARLKSAETLSGIWNKSEKKCLTFELYLCRCSWSFVLFAEKLPRIFPWKHLNNCKHHKSLTLNKADWKWILRVVCYAILLIFALRNDFRYLHLIKWFVAAFSTKNFSILLISGLYVSLFILHPGRSRKQTAIINSPAFYLLTHRASFFDINGI